MAFLFDALSKLGEIINPQGHVDYTLPGNYAPGGDVCVDVRVEENRYDEDDPVFRKNLVEIVSKLVEANTGHAPQNTLDFRIMMFSITMIKGGFIRKSWWIPVNHPLAILLRNHARHYNEWHRLDALHSSQYGQVYVYDDETMREMFRTLLYMFEEEGVNLENMLSESEEEEEEEEEEKIPTVAVEYSQRSEGSKKAD